MDEGDTWGIPGGALEASESPMRGATREVEEELGLLPPFSVLNSFEYAPADDWSYTTFVAEVDEEFVSDSEDWEHGGGDWFTAAEMRDLPLHPAFAQTLPDLRLAMGGDPLDIQNWNLQGWFHSSWVPLPLGTVLVPGGEGGSGTNFDRLYQNSPDYNWHSEYVWITDDLRWASDFLEGSGSGYIYRVEPMGFVQQQADHQYYTTEARIVEIVAQWDWESPEREDGRRDTYDWKYDVLVAKTAAGDWDMSGNVPVWVQPHDELVADALSSWKGDPASMMIWVNNLQQDPYRIPDSGSGKIMKAQAQALLEELDRAPSTPRKLYRGDHNYPSFPSAWSEVRSVAKIWAERGGGQVWTIDGGQARGIRVADYISNGRDETEREWVVIEGDPKPWISPTKTAGDHIDGDVLRGHEKAFELGLVGGFLEGDDAIERYLLPVLGPDHGADFLAVTDPSALTEAGAGAMIEWSYPEGGSSYGVPTLTHPGFITEFTALHEAAHVIVDHYMPGLESHDQRWLDTFMGLLDAYLPEAAEVMRDYL